MADITSTVGLDASTYIQAVETIIKKLQEYQEAADAAKKAGEQFANTPLPKIPVGNVSADLQKVAAEQKKLIDEIKNQYTALTTHMKSISETLQQQFQKTQQVTTASKTQVDVAKQQVTQAQAVNKELEKRKGIIRAALIQEENAQKAAFKPKLSATDTSTATPEARRKIQEIQTVAYGEHAAKLRRTLDAVAKSYDDPNKPAEKVAEETHRAMNIMSGVGNERERAQLLQENIEAHEAITSLKRKEETLERRVTNEIQRQLRTKKQVREETEKQAKKTRGPAKETDAINDIYASLSGKLKLGAHPFLERYSDKRVATIQPGTTLEDTKVIQDVRKKAEAQAELHFRGMRRDVFARYASDAEKTKLTVANAYAKDPEGKEKAAHAIDVMMRAPSTDPQKRLAEQREEDALLKENLTAYTALVRLKNTVLTLENKITAEVNKQSKLARETVSKAEKDQVAFSQEKLRASLLQGRQLEWLQTTFQKTHGREITGFGKVDVTRAGHQLLDVYSKTPIDLKGKYKDLATGSDVGNFQKIIAEMQKGNTELIGQYPELARAASGYNKAIKYGEVESARFVAHWDNFFRLVLARGITLVFYSISNAIKQATTDAIELWKSIAEIQTISGTTKMSVDQWALSVKNLSNVYHIAQQDVVEALYQIQSNQVAVGQGAIVFAGTAAGLAKATKSSLTEAVNALSSIVNSYNISVSNAEIISAQLFKTVELGRVRLGDMANTIGRITSMSSLLGVSLESVEAMIQFITVGGVKFERSGTYIVNIMNSLLKPSDKMKAFFSSIKVDSGEAAIALYGFGGVLQRLMDYTHGSAGELSEVVKNLRAITGYASVTRDIGKYEELVGKTKTAMESYLEAQKYIYTGPGERFLEIVTKGKNVFIDAAQSILHALLRVDDWLKKEHADILHLGLTKGAGIHGLADAPAYIPALGTLVGVSLLGRTMAALPNDPVISKAFKSAGNRWGAILAAGVFLNTRMNLYAEKMLNDLKDNYSDFIDDTKIAMEKRYHEEQNLIEETLKKHTQAFMKQKTALKTALAEQAQEWKNYYATITRPLEITLQSAKDLQNIYEGLISRREDLFVGFAANPLDAYVRKVAVSRDILSRLDAYGSENTLQIAQRFIERSESTLGELDKKIQEIITSKGKAEDSMFLEPILMLRDDLTSMMDYVLGRYAEEIGAPKNVKDLYEGLFGAKTLEQKWDDYFKEFKDLAEKVGRALEDESMSSQAIKDLLYLQLTEQQKRIYTRDIESEPKFQAYLERATALNLALEKEFEERTKIEKQREQIGAGKSSEYMQGDVFNNLYAAAQVLAKYDPEQFNAVAKLGGQVQKTYAGHRGIIPRDQQEQFDASLKEFIDNFGSGNEALRRRIEEIANSWGITPGRLAEKKAAQLILATYEDTLSESLAPRTLKAGGGVIGGPQGTDTVPAWLTPGEFVVRREMAQKHAHLLEKLNAGYYADGGSVQEALRMFWLQQQQQQPRRYMFQQAGMMPHALPMTWQQQYMQQQYMQQQYMQQRSGPSRGEQAIARRKAIQEKYEKLGYDVIFHGLNYNIIPKREAVPIEPLQKGGSFSNLGQDLHRAMAVKILGKSMQGAIITEEEKQYMANRMQAGDVEKMRRSMEDASKIHGSSMNLGERGFNRHATERHKLILERQKMVGGHKNLFDKFYGTGTWKDYFAGGVTGALAALIAMTGWSLSPSLGGASILAGGKTAGTAALGLGKGLLGALGLGSVKQAAVTTGLVGMQELFAALTDSEYKGRDILKRLPMEIFLARMLGSGAPKSNTLNYQTQEQLLAAMASGGWVGQPRGRFQSGGSVSGQTINNYSTTANVTMQSSGNEGYDARRLIDNVNRELHRGTRRLVNVS